MGFANTHQCGDNTEVYLLGWDMQGGMVEVQPADTSNPVLRNVTVAVFGSGLVAARYGPLWWVRLVGVASMTLTIAAYVWTWRLLRLGNRSFGARFVAASDKSVDVCRVPNSGTEFKAWVAALTRSTGDWVDLDARGLTRSAGDGDDPADRRVSFVRCWDALFADYRSDSNRSFIVADLGLTLFISVLQGLMGASNCNTVQIIVLVLLAAYPVLLIVVRPHESKVALAIAVALAVLQWVGGSMAVAATYLEPAADAMQFKSPLMFTPRCES